MEMQELQGQRSSTVVTLSCLALTRGRQRESTASIKLSPKPYEQGEPPKAQSILEFDCRGLEFTEFHPEVTHLMSLGFFLKMVTD